jgi:hypothetical protein
MNAWRKQKSLEKLYQLEKKASGLEKLTKNTGSGCANSSCRWESDAGPPMTLAGG